MSHSEACRNAYRLGDGSYCIGKPRCAHGVPVDAREAVPTTSPQPEMPERSMDHAWFCPQCGLRDETDGGLDGDGTCSSCGCDCCTWNSLNSHLAHMGWHVITTEQRAVLDAALALPEKQLRAALIGKPFRASHVLREFAVAELAQRAAKEGTNG